MLDIGKKLRAARQERDLSLRELAAKVEVSASMISQIETGKANPSVRSLHSIADALGVSIDYFFFPGQEESSLPAESVAEDRREVTASRMRQLKFSSRSKEPEFDHRVPVSGNNLVLHPADRPRIDLKGGVQWTRLTAEAEKDVEFLEIVYRPGASSGAKMSHHVGREFGLVVEGELQLELGFDQFVLQAGDSIIFDSNVPHRLSNPGEKPMRAIWVVIHTAE